MANNICRVCLIDDGKTRNLFDLNISLPDGILFPFHEMLSFCCSVNLLRNIEQFICDKCILACTNAYIFIKLFQKNNETFEKLLRENAKCEDEFVVPQIKVEVMDEDIKTELDDEEEVSFDPLFIDPDAMESEIKMEEIDDEDQENTLESESSADKSTAAVESKTHKCPSCALIFRYYPQFHEHLKMHPDIKTCHICKENCQNTDDFEKHYYQTHYNFCDICNKSFLNRKRFWRHREIHHPRLNSRKAEKNSAALNGDIKNKHNCPACPTFNLSYTEFGKHIKRHPNVRFCHICKEDCKNLDGFQQHYYRAHYFYCNICNVYFPSRHKFNYHRAVNHPHLLNARKEKDESETSAISGNFDVSQKHKCPLCLEFYVSYSDFLNHVKQHKANIKTCHICSLNCKKSQDFFTHYYHAHYLYCTHCTLSFQTENEYKTHKANCQRDLSTASMEKIKTEPDSDGEKDKVKSGVHKCPLCPLSFAFVPSFMKHLRLHQNIETCHICKVDCKNTDGFEDHYRQAHHNNCNICKIRFLTRKEYMRHIRSCHNESYDSKSKSGESKGTSDHDSAPAIKLRKSKQTQHICPFCKVSMNKLNTFRVHLHFHLNYDKSPVTCTSCPVQCENLKNFYTHYISEHYIECTECKTYFTNKDKLQNHFCRERTPRKRRIKKTVENPLLKYKCDICEEKFASYNQLHYHRRKKHNLTQHLCPECGQMFVNQAELKDHMWVHTGVKEYSCEKCNRQFIRLDALKKHVKKDLCTVKETE